MSLGSIVGGVISAGASLLGGGGSNKASQSMQQKPAKWEDQPKQFFDTWFDRFWGTPEQTTTTGGTVANSAQAGDIQKQIEFLQAAKEGRNPYLKMGVYTGKPYYSVPSGMDDDTGNMPSGHGASGSYTQDQMQLAYDIATGKTDIDAEIDRLQNQLQTLSSATGGTTTTTPAQPGYEQLLLDQDKWLRDRYGEYEGAMTRAIRPYQTSIQEASAGAIPVSIGGMSLGGLIPQGGMNLGQRMMQANMIMPETRWQFQQQMPQNKAELDYLNKLQDIAMQFQSMRYGIPSQTTSANIGNGTSMTSALLNAAMGMQLGNQLGAMFQQPTQTQLGVNPSVLSGKALATGNYR